jgi:anion transporter
MWSAAVPILLAAGIIFAAPRPEVIRPEGWRLFGIFVGAVAGLVMQPIPGGAVVLIAVTLAGIFGGLTPAQALSGYGEPTSWLVLVAFFIARALIKTGLARRIALLFVRAVGSTSLGICYALTFSDVCLSAVIPSNAARSGGVTLPILRSLCEVYGSTPGKTAGLLGSFLMVAIYQNVCINSAIFLTGQASNPLAAQIAAHSFHFPITWTSWFVAGSVPGLCSLLLAPLVVFRLNPPEIRRTPEAAAFALKELRAMGPMKGPEKIVLAVFISVCACWATTPLHGIDVTLTALLGVAALLVASVLTWEDVKNEKAAWDVFVWYGGLLMLEGTERRRHHQRVRPCGGGAVRISRLARAVRHRTAALLLRALRLRQHHGAPARDVHAVRGRADRQGRPGRASRVRVRLLHQPGRGTYELRHHSGADVLRPGLRYARPLVESGSGSLGGEPRDLVLGRLPLVEADRAVVTAATTPGAAATSSSRAPQCRP